MFRLTLTPVFCLSYVVAGMFDATQSPQAGWEMEEREMVRDRMDDNAKSKSNASSSRLMVSTKLHAMCRLSNCLNQNTNETFACYEVQMYSNSSDADSHTHRRGKSVCIFCCCQKWSPAPKWWQTANSEYEQTNSFSSSILLVRRVHRAQTAHHNWNRNECMWDRVRSPYHGVPSVGCSSFLLFSVVLPAHVIDHLFFVSRIWNDSFSVASLTLPAIISKYSVVHWTNAWMNV